MIGTEHSQGQQDNSRARTGETQVSGFLILAPFGMIVWCAKWSIGFFYCVNSRNMCLWICCRVWQCKCMELIEIHEHGMHSRGHYMNNWYVNLCISS